MSSLRKTIAELHDGGLRNPEIARELQVAPTTVSYHLGRILAERAAAEAAIEQDLALASTSAVIQSKTRVRVERMLAEGSTKVEIARRLAISKASVSYHVRRLGHPVAERCARRYDWDAIQRYYDEGHSVRECIKVFGFTTSSWFDAVKRGAIVSRPSATPMSLLLVANTYRGRNNLLENLQLLCPNCHSQTDNYAGRNGRDRPENR